ncbi:MAG: plasmid stabilization protein [Gammaproteobacteria bacterium]|nr:plasmid stabilization protein [Gammaproteobacteria bacterium]MBU1724864.1 plasmid stabilization protein [Gammaproteobacteria bacterium]MBU2005048.1 plasmid stabilization protein [Gammaproteobacteria bacterium]
MAMLTIRNLDDELKTQLRIRAAQHGLSMEEEVRRILQQVLSPQNPCRGFGSRIHQKVMALTGGIDLPLPQRSVPRPPPDFSGDAV